MGRKAKNIKYMSVHVRLSEQDYSDLRKVADTQEILPVATLVRKWILQNVAKYEKGKKKVA